MKNLTKLQRKEGGIRMKHDNNKYFVTGYFIHHIIEFLSAGALGGAIVAMCYGHQTCGWALLCLGMFANLLTDMLGRETNRLHKQLDKTDENKQSN